MHYTLMNRKQTIHVEVTKTKSLSRLDINLDKGTNSLT